MLKSEKGGGTEEFRFVEPRFTHVLKRFNSLLRTYRAKPSFRNQVSSTLTSRKMSIRDIFDNFGCQNYEMAVGSSWSAVACSKQICCNHQLRKGVTS
jgi:hypothetical protein